MQFPALPIVAESLSDPNPWMILPFAAMLLSIALAPFVVKHHWERHYGKVAVFLGSISVVYYLAVLEDGARMLGVAHEYISFLALVGSLYVISGGIHITVKGEAKPWVNCVFLFIGAVISNIIGTTGASMLLIRPWLRMNKYRLTAHHIVFFIFIVSNVGGCLTPIGDPPLFLGYLKGVPFWWVLEKCWKAWAIGVGGLLAIFYVADRANFLRAPRDVREMETRSETWRFEGLTNLFFLAVVLAGVFITQPAGLREVLMIGAAVGSYFATPRRIHESNDFTFGPIKEVAWLFAGIFATMVPALDYLAHHATSLGLRSELQFYWLTGVLSAVLDNAPTYLTFLAMAFGIAGLSMDNSAHIATFIAQHDHYLMAISIGAVFFGAMTYIGNGPNFMVKAIAEQAGAKVPGFGGYVLRFSVPILLPFLFLVSVLFFSRFRVF
jgi:Na+/H+ antiporter NhaD/arsenite permease-like protein